jgi:hypothetical protein
MAAIGIIIGFIFSVATAVIETKRELAAESAHAQEIKRRCCVIPNASCIATSNPQTSLSIRVGTPRFWTLGWRRLRFPPVLPAK